MSLFGTIVAADLALVFAGLSTGFSLIDTSGWGGPGVFLSLLTTIFLLFLLASLRARSLAALGRVRRGRFLSPGLRFFNPGVFHRAALTLSGGGIGWPGTLRTMLVCFTSSGARPECRLGLGVDCFLYRVLEAVQFAAALLHFGPDRRF